MMRNNADKSTIRKFIYGGLLFIMLLLITATLAFSQDDRKVETIRFHSNGYQYADG